MAELNAAISCVSIKMLRIGSILSFNGATWKCVFF